MASLRCWPLSFFYVILGKIFSAEKKRTIDINHEINSVCFKQFFVRSNFFRRIVISRCFNTSVMLWSEKRMWNATKKKKAFWRDVFESFFFTLFKVLFLKRDFIHERNTKDNYYQRKSYNLDQMANHFFLLLLSQTAKMSIQEFRKWKILFVLNAKRLNFCCCFVAPVVVFPFFFALLSVVWLFLMFFSFFLLISLPFCMWFSSFSSNIFPFFFRLKNLLSIHSIAIFIISFCIETKNWDGSRSLSRLISITILFLLIDAISLYFFRFAPLCLKIWIRDGKFHKLWQNTLNEPKNCRLSTSLVMKVFFFSRSFWTCWMGFWNIPDQNPNVENEKKNLSNNNHGLKRFFFVSSLVTRWFSQ